MLKIRTLLLAAPIVGLIFQGGVHAAGEYKFGVFPYLPPTKLNALFRPITKDLSEAIDNNISLSSKPTYREFTEQLDSEAFDIAFVQPFDYVDAYDNKNYLPLARRGKGLKALLLVAKDSPIKSISDVKGKRIANPPKVAAVSHLTSMALIEAGIDPETDVDRHYGKSHFSCMQRVLINSADVCGTAGQALFHFEKKKMRGRFRILAESPSIPHSLFIIHKRVPESDRKKIFDRIINWEQSDNGREILSNGKFIPFVEAKDSDYDIVRKYNKTRLK